MATDKKVVIKNADMAEDVQQVAINIAKQVSKFWGFNLKTLSRAKLGDNTNFGKLLLLLIVLLIFIYSILLTKSVKMREKGSFRIMTSAEVSTRYFTAFPCVFASWKIRLILHFLIR